LQHNENNTSRVRGDNRLGRRNAPCVVRKKSWQHDRENGSSGETEHSTGHNREPNRRR